MYKTVLAAALHRVFMQEAGTSGSGGGGGTPPGTGGTAPGAAPGVSANDGGGGSPPPNGSGDPWYSSFKDEPVKNWLKSYGDAYPSAEAVAAKAFNLEKFIGADKAGRGIVIPKADAPPEEWNAVWAKLGRPEKPDGYKMPETLKADPLMSKFRDQAHKLGMPAGQFEGVVAWYEAEMKGVAEGNVAAWEQKAAQELEAVEREWGAQRDQNVELGRRAAKAFLPHSNPEELHTLLNKMEGALGTATTMKLWAAVGKGMMEHNFEQGEGNGGQGGLTAEGARVRIAALKGDPEWSKKYAAGGADERAEWDRLHKIAYPDQQ